MSAEGTSASRISDTIAADDNPALSNGRVGDPGSSVRLVVTKDAAALVSSDVPVLRFSGGG